MRTLNRELFECGEVLDAFERTDAFTVVQNNRLAAFGFRGADLSVVVQIDSVFKQPGPECVVGNLDEYARIDVFLLFLLLVLVVARGAADVQCGDCEGRQNG